MAPRSGRRTRAAQPRQVRGGRGKRLRPFRERSSCLRITRQRARGEQNGSVERCGQRVVTLQHCHEGRREWIAVPRRRRPIRACHGRRRRESASTASRPTCRPRRSSGRRRAASSADGTEAQLDILEARLQGGTQADRDAVFAGSELAPHDEHSPAIAPIAGIGADDAGMPRSISTSTSARTGAWLTGHRLGDMRRLVRNYQRNTEKVFPTGDPSDAAGRRRTEPARAS